MFDTIDEVVIEVIAQRLKSRTVTGVKSLVQWLTSRNRGWC